MDTFDNLHQQLTFLQQVKGITPVDVLTLPEPLRGPVRRMMRKGAMTLDELAGELSLPQEEARQLGDILVEKGFLQTEEPVDDNTMVYRIYFARMRKHNIPLDL